MRKLVHWGLVVCVLLLGAQESWAQVCLPKTDKEAKTQAALKYLRRLSLDLRGRVPSYGELNAVAQKGYVDDSVIDGMLKSNLFLTQMREYFKDLLTLNISDLQLRKGNRTAIFQHVNSQGFLRKAGETPFYTVIDRGSTVDRLTMRGDPTAFCLDEPVKKQGGEILCKIKSTGKYVTCLQAYKDRLAGKKNVAQEGYEMIQPYWEKDPTKKVKVCALAALANKTFTYGKTTYRCDAARSAHTTDRAPHRAFCGCGPNLNWCLRSGEGRTKGLVNMETEVFTSILEQTLRLIDTVVKNDRPYTDILLTKEAEVNGHISQLINKTTYAARLEFPSSTEIKVPNIPYYEKDNWQKITRGTREAGILTLPFFLYKYATNRGRLHRFHNAFLCQYFTPPAGGLPNPTDKCHDEPNLTKRCGCSHCHVTIEPEASHWGRWHESSWFPLLGGNFPTYNKLCDKRQTKTGNPSYCKNLYMFTPKHKTEEPYQGKLLAYVFATKTWETNISQGPRTLVNKYINDKNKTIATCGVKKMYSWFTGADLQSQQSHVLNDFKTTFLNSNYNVRAIVKAIVKSEEYRRGFATHQP